MNTLPGINQAYVIIVGDKSQTVVKGNASLIV